MPQGRIKRTALLVLILAVKKNIRTQADEIGDFMVNDNKALQIAKYAMMFAIIFVAMMLDKAISQATAFLGIGFSMAGCALLVTLSFCFLDNKWLTAVLSGVFLGVASFLKEFIMPSLALEVLPFYYWPFITVLPRVVMTSLAFATYRLVLALGKNKPPKARQVLALTLGALVGLVTNTFGFLGATQIAYRVYVSVHGATDGITLKNVFAVVYAVLLTNILPEYAISLVGVSPVVIGTRRGLKIDVNNKGEQQ